MTFPNNGIKAVLFDYGNTLIEYGPEQVDAQYVALEKELSGMFGHCNSSHLKAIRDRQTLAPFHNGYVENDMELINAVKNAISIPVIASSGAGSVEHFYEVFTKTPAESAFAAGIFHRREVPIAAVKEYLKDKVEIRM